jgi:hypothetical protein
MMRRIAMLFAFCMLYSLGVAAAQPRADTDADPRELLVLLRLPPEHFRPGDGYAGNYGDALGASARRRVAARIAKEHGLALGIDWPMPLAGVHCFVMALPEGETPEHALRALALDPAVAWAQPMHVYHARAAPADPLYPTQPTARTWQLAALHEVATGRDVSVAVIDSGIEPDHPDLAGAVATSQNFVAGRPDAAELHGTAVAGLIAARDNGVGIVGVAPRARLLALRACWQRTADATVCSSLSLAMALHFAIAHDAQVINLSLAGPPDRLLDALLDAALARGATVVAAADRSLPEGGFPASHRGVLGVVADDGTGALPGGYAAPGRDLPTSVPPARWQLVSGASYAAAEVSGLAALLRELRADPTRMLAAAPSGVIDACASVARALSPGASACDETRLARP